MKINEICYDQRSNNFIFTIRGKSYRISYNKYIEWNLHIGDLLTLDQMETIRQEDAVNCCQTDALRYASYKKRSESEIRRKLSEGGYDADLIDIAVKSLIKLGYIDDRSYTEAFISDQVRLNLRSRIQIYAKLKEKGIDEETIRSGLARLTDEKEANTLDRIIEKKCRIRPPRDERERDRLIRSLQRRGFSYALIRQAVSKLSIEDNPDD